MSTHASRRMFLDSSRSSPCTRKSIYNIDNTIDIIETGSWFSSAILGSTTYMNRLSQLLKDFFAITITVPGILREIKTANSDMNVLYAAFGNYIQDRTRFPLGSEGSDQAFEAFSVHFGRKDTLKLLRISDEQLRLYLIDITKVINCRPLTVKDEN
jgi:hypothetical protein